MCEQALKGAFLARASTATELGEAGIMREGATLALFTSVPCDSRHLPFQGAGQPRREVGALKTPFLPPFFSDTPLSGSGSFLWESRAQNSVNADAPHHKDTDHEGQLALSGPKHQEHHDSWETPGSPSSSQESK